MPSLDFGDLFFKCAQLLSSPFIAWIYDARRMDDLLTKDPIATMCFILGFSLGAIRCGTRLFARWTSLMVLLIVFCASIFWPVQDNHGIVWEVYPHAWTKTIFPTMVDFGTPRDGFLITMIHSDDIMGCYMRNNAYHEGGYIRHAPGSWEDVFVAKKATCLSDAARWMGTTTPPERYDDFIEWTMIHIFPEHISTQCMLMNEVIGCFERTCIATFAGFFVGVFAFSATFRDAFNMKFSGKHCMISFLCCKFVCFVVMLIMSRHHPWERKVKFSGGTMAELTQKSLLVLSDPSIWYAGCCVFRLFSSVDFETLCGTMTTLCDTMIRGHRDKRIAADAKRMQADAKQATADARKAVAADAKQAAADEKRAAAAVAKAAAAATKA